MPSIDPSRRGEAATALARVVADALPVAYRAPLAARGVRVLLIDAAQWHATLPAARPWLDPAEAARVARKRLAHDRDLLTLAYALHRLWLAHCLGCDPAAVPLIRDARGQPQLPGTHLHTSLSHCDGAIAIAVGAAGIVGVDIEPGKRSAEMSELAGHICHPNERHALAGMPITARQRALLRLWVRKEALLKAVGVGLRWEMAGFEAPARVPIKFINVLNNDLQVIDIETGNAFVAALAGRPDGIPECAWLRPSPPIDHDPMVVQL